MTTDAIHSNPPLRPLDDPRVPTRSELAAVVEAA